MKQNRSRLAALLILGVLLISGLVGGAVGKYIKTMQFNGKITFSATLATGMVLQEHQVERKADGDYETIAAIIPTEVDGTTVNTNQYVLLPGHDIPKDPYIIITGKTSIPAYLFVEVIDGTADTLTYTVEDHWLKLDGLTGKNGGAVYVYSTTNPVDARTPQAIDNTFAGTVNILKGNKVTVSQELRHGALPGNLDFYACMGETAFSENSDGIEQAKEVYKKLNNMT